MINYNNFILEYIRNEKNVKFYLRKILSGIRNLNPDVFRYGKEFDKDVWSLTIDTLDTYEKQSEDILKKYQRELLKDSTYLYYKKSYTPEMDFENNEIIVKENGKLYLTFHVWIKDVHIQRVKPTEFVYHTSLKTNTKNILENGLIPQENLNFWDSPSLNHPPMIFATLREPLWQIDSDPDDIDIWEIDTTKINNKWWLDPNMFTHMRGKEMITTFEPIPPSALKIVSEEYL